MIEIMECSHCHQKVGVSFFKGFAHLECVHCHKKYQLDSSCLLLYFLIPFLCVGAAMFVRITLIPTVDIFIKTIVILLGSYLLYFFTCMILVKLKILKYCQRRGG
ncbi:MAG: hypothetical protein EOM50_05580 [Erysipelotrichia bacterium]|nr:hypothetical protein [Erysipelotrichia bacterium]NCC54200.1 hypothetical protein [Erysipelotrichia bacterium]